jgi:hypothetical protein
LFYRKARDDLPALNAIESEKRMTDVRSGWMIAAALLAGFFCAAGATSASAQASKKTPPTDSNFVANAFVEIETENLFGFTEGTDIGQPGEKEIGWESVGNFNKRTGNYKTWEHKLELGYTIENIHLELGILGVSAAITNVPDLDNRHINAFAGLSGELKWLIVNRGPGAPVGLALAIEPEWARIDDGDGSRVRKYAVETTLMADTELVPDRLYLGANIVYEPEVISKRGEPIEHESSLTFRTALSYRVLPWLAIGPEFQHMRAYDMGIGLNHFVGYANFIGPSLYIALGPKATLTFAWGHQVRGKSIEEPDQRLNLVDFSRDIGRIKANFEF